MPEPPRRLLVTGGAGFLASALVEQLREAPPGERPEEVRLFDLRPAPEPEPWIRAVQGDVRDAKALREACTGVDCVIHAAARVDWGHAGAAALEAVNVGGTRNAVRACQEAGVPALVHTSTLDVVFGDAPVRDADETWPVPERHGNDYARTKACAERVALVADGTPRAARPGETGEPALRTCAVRPCGMWGEADPYHTTRFVETLRRGSLRLRIGDGRARFQHCYVGNAAHALWLAARALHAGAPGVAGEVFFVTDAPARNIFDHMEPVARGLGLAMPPRRPYLPAAPARWLGAVLETAARVLPFEPTLTRSSVRFLTEDLTITSDKARRLLGYEPRYSEAESVARTVAWFQDAGRASR